MGSLDRLAGERTDLAPDEVEHLQALIGAWGGWQVLPLTLLLSSVVGALVGVFLLRMRKHSIGMAMPFGPYLAIAGWIAVLWGDEIYASYIQLLGY